ncbi:MAG TPA: hypothetical protein VJ063_10250, partial [Verrucomicrobiae bacterium]|nr:hypothetical protein [Verrucomicrobiae bacterium]
AEGYTLASTNASANFSFFSDRGAHHDPDASRPVVIKMWRLKGAEPLVRVSKEYRFPVPTNSIHIDLLTAKIVPSGGDIELTVQRPPGEVSFRSKAHWTLIVKAVDGRVQEADGIRSSLTFEAPTAGYGDAIRVEQNPEDQYWKSSVTLGAFLESRNQQVFSKLAISFGINEDPNALCWLGLRSLANPNGSRNWEEDPLKIKVIQK